ncbi:type III pantothenate kinase [Candidatus Pelagibacter communis]|uniref:type III pantothenate kinase n=1 Tax=Pelagibacter ubique TaxID=198252 RepID=UPI00094CE4CB|nr:type III pantothenate kinase [Candidatus Pelagibacter ubique]
MIIVGDIGNTEIKICFFYNGLKKKYLFKTDSLNKKIIRNKFNFLRKKIYLKNAIISSVVPKTFSQIKKIFFNLYKVNCIELKKLNLTRLINIKVNKKEIGSDRLANAISVMSKKKNFIVVDFGTATTFDVIKKNNYLGGVIAPGVNLSLDNLIKKASLIPNVKLNKSKSIIGKNTEQAVLSGFFWGYNGLINGIISKIKKKTNQKYKIVFTGGLAHLFNKDIKDKVTIDKNLTINGLIKVSKHFNL